MKHLFPLVLFIPLSSYATDITSVKNCLETKYSNLKDYNSIVAAVIDPDKSEIMTFGNAKVDHLFEIGSITKTMTGTLLAKAALENKVKIKNPIPDIYQKPGTQITYGHLTTHTSRLTNSIGSYYEIINKNFAYEGLTKTKFKELYPGIKLDFTPGEKYNYSNTGVALLGLLLEEAYTKSYEVLIQENIFDTLGMKDSYFEVPIMQMHRFSQGNENGKV